MDDTHSRHAHNESQHSPEHMVHSFDDKQKKKVTISTTMVIAALVIIVAGGATGFVFAKSSSTSGGSNSIKGSSGQDDKSVKMVVGNCDPKICKDSAEGLLKEGGIDGVVGTHHLERPGGDSQTVYLTSSTIPLDDYIGKNVKVTGETLSSTAGWFMDVGKLEVL